MTKRSKSKDRQREIVAITLQLLASTSLERLSTRQIAGALSISQPALFRHFPSRDDLLLAVVDHTRANLAALAEEVLAAGNAEEQLAQLMTRFFAFIEEHPGLPALLFSSALPEDGPVRHALKHIMAMQVNLVAELVREGQTKRQFNPSIPAKVAATAFIGLIQGTVFQWRLADCEKPLGQDASTLYRLWLDGIAANSDGEPAGLKRAGTSGESTADADSGESTGPPEIAELDVRPTIAEGLDPQLLIFRQVSVLCPRSVLKIIAPFRPSPLVALLEQRGHSATVTESGPQHFQVEIVIGGGASIDDLRDLEPPGPLERVLEEGTRLAEGGVYLARLPRFPRLLLPHLEQRKLVVSVYEESDGTVLILVRKERS